MLNVMTRTRKTEIQTALSTRSPTSQPMSVVPSLYRNLIALETATSCSPARTAYANLAHGSQQGHPQQHTKTAAELFSPVDPADGKTDTAAHEPTGELHDRGVDGHQRRHLTQTANDRRDNWTRR